MWNCQVKDTSTVPLTHFNLQKLSLPYQRYPPPKRSYHDSLWLWGHHGPLRCREDNLHECALWQGAGLWWRPGTEHKKLIHNFWKMDSMKVFENVVFFVWQGVCVETQGEQKVWRHIDWLIDIELYPDALIILHMIWSPPQVFLSTPNGKPLKELLTVTFVLRRPPMVRWQEKCPLMRLGRLTISPWNGGNPLDFKDEKQSRDDREAQEGQLDLHTMKQGMGFVPQAGGGFRSEDRMDDTSPETDV